jgi:hypothetical protein
MATFSHLHGGQRGCAGAPGRVKGNSGTGWGSQIQIDARNARAGAQRANALHASFAAENDKKVLEKVFNDKHEEAVARENERHADATALENKRHAGGSCYARTKRTLVRLILPCVARAAHRRHAARLLALDMDHATATKRIRDDYERDVCPLFVGPIALLPLFFTASHYRLYLNDTPASELCRAVRAAASVCGAETTFDARKGEMRLHKIATQHCRDKRFFECVTVQIEVFRLPAAPGGGPGRILLNWTMFGGSKVCAVHLFRVVCIALRDYATEGNNIEGMMDEHERPRPSRLARARPLPKKFQHEVPPHTMEIATKHLRPLLAGAALRDSASQIECVRLLTTMTRINADPEDEVDYAVDAAQAMAVCSAILHPSLRGLLEAYLALLPLVAAVEGSGALCDPVMRRHIISTTASLSLLPGRGDDVRAAVEGSGTLYEFRRALRPHAEGGVLGGVYASKEARTALERVLTDPTASPEK